MTHKQQEFNKYCADVMGYKIDTSYPELFVYFPDEAMPRLYSPYNDLNQMSEVVEKLLSNDQTYYSGGQFPNKHMVSRDGFKQAFRDFIISTMEKE
jgi:hypothetical protein